MNRLDRIEARLIGIETVLGINIGVAVIDRPALPGDDAARLRTPKPSPDAESPADSGAGPTVNVEPAPAPSGADIASANPGDAASSVMREPAVYLSPGHREVPAISAADNARLGDIPACLRRA